MSVTAFLKLVEIKTKIASIFPFLIGSLYVYYRFNTFKTLNTLVFFSAMLVFDLTTTAINNYMDYRKAASDEYRRTKNIIGQENISEKLVVFIIFTMLSIAALLGILLVTRTDLLVLLIGMMCFAIGILYTFGPIPISRMPLGEIFSGITMGFGILFLTVYVNAFDKGIASLTISGGTVLFQANILTVLEILLVSIPCIFTISNIMLANNICDLEDDIKNNRFTLPFYIGRKYAIWLFNALYMGIFIAIVISVWLNLLPKTMLLSFALIYPVYRQISSFNREQIKATTFNVAIKNLVMINGTISSLLLFSILI